MQQQRIMQTYRIEIGATPVDVNLSFPLDADNNPIDSNGRPIGNVTAYAELTKRLRKLARTKRVAVTTEELDTNDWSAPRIVRQRFVTVEVDEQGRAVKGVGR